MKKILLMTASLLAFSAAAYAANVDLTTISGLTFKPSANVTVSYGGSNTQAYVVNSKHLAGDRLFSSSNATSKIWYNTSIAKGTALAATGGETTSGQDDAGYVAASWLSQ